jgi:prepilin-type N-terminal cleavage/methylation domain-containing protein
MTPATRSARGFSLVELMIVLTIFGMLVGFGIPQFRRYGQTQALRGSAENLVQAVNLQRSRAMSTGQAVTLNFNTSAPFGWTCISQGYSHVTRLPNGVRFDSATPSTLTLGRDGRVSTSGMVVFVNRVGATDTVSIQISGMALVR